MPSPAPISARLCAILALAAVAAPLALAQSAPPPATEEVFTLSPFVVSAADQGYRATNTVSGTKINTPIKEIPMNLQVVTEQFMADTNANDIIEALSYTAGVRTEANIDSSTTNQGVSIRGFRSTWQLRNGFRRYDRQESTNTQRIEIINGPAAVLYGITQPGGIVNTITKRPLPKASFSTEFVTASRESWTVRGDLNQPLGQWADARLTGSYRESNGWRDHDHDEMLQVTPVVLFRPTKNTEVVLEWERSIYDDGTAHQPLRDGNTPVADLFGVPIAFNYFGSDAVKRHEIDNVMLLVDHKFSDNFTVRLGANSNRRDQLTDRPEGLSVQTVSGLRGVRLNWRKIYFANDMMSYNADALWKFETGPVKHQLLLGGQFSQDEFFREEYRDTTTGTTERTRFFAFNDPAPVLTRPADINYIPRTANGEFRTEDNRVTAGYFTHTGRYFDSKLISLAGVFYTEIDYTSVRSNNTTPSTSARKANPQVGLVWQPTKTVSVFGLYATSLFPLSVGTLDGFLRPFSDPETGESYEAGVKLSLWDDRISGTVSAFDIKQGGRVLNDPLAPNINTVYRPDGTPDPNTLGANVQVGETTSRGVSLAFDLRIADRWDAILSYTNMEAFVSRDPNPALIDRNLAGTTPHSLALFTKYTFDRKGALKGLSLSGGLSWQDDLYREFRSPFTGAPQGWSYRKAFQNGSVNAAYNWKWGARKLSVSFHATNLFEEEIVVGYRPNSQEGIYYNTPANYSFVFGVRF